MFKEGKSVAAHPVRITYKLIDSSLSIHPSHLPGSLKAGFSVSSRNFKKAVDRNRIKRLLRESYRKQKSILPESLTVDGTQVSVAIFIIFTGKELPAYEFVDEKMKLALNKLADQLR